MRAILLFVFLLASAPAMRACAECKKFRSLPTVTADEPDRGGLFFGKKPPEEKTRHFYIAAEPTVWTWVPQEENTNISARPLPPDLLARPSSPKIRYVQYTDATFTQRVLETPRLGICGPVLRGVVGDFLAVTFKNNAGQPLSMHPHGVRYDVDSEGSYNDANVGLGSAVGSGAVFTYVWQLDALSGPQIGEPSSKCWLYHSHSKGDEEINQGLFGMIVVTDPSRARPDGTPNDVDREMATMFVVFDEAPEDEALEYLKGELAVDMVPRPWTVSAELKELGERPSINGRLFGNLAGLEMREGERVRWYVASLGDAMGVHTAHWHGERLLENGRSVVDVVGLLPGETKVVDMMADNPGTWLLHCHVEDHMMEGMFAQYSVLPANAPAPGQPFFSLMPENPSLTWTEAKADLDLSADSQIPLKITLRGKVSIYLGFFPPSNPVTLIIGHKKIPLFPQDNAVAIAPGARLEFLGGNEQGIIMADTAEFSLVLEGSEWREVIEAAGVDLKTAGKVEVPIDMQVGDATHHSKLALQLIKKNDRLVTVNNP